jgi:hypothetical protein
MDIFTEARNLVQRYEKGDAFRLHVRERLPLIVPALAIFLAISSALGLGLFPMMGTNRFGVLVAIMLVPFVLLGSLALQVYLFFSWLELRALQPLLEHGKAPLRGSRPESRLAVLRLRLGKPPPIPWIAVAVLLFLPLLVLAAASLKAALLVVAGAVLTPIVYALLDSHRMR